MKSIIRKMFARGGPAAGQSVSSELASNDIESYYRGIISKALERMLVPAGTVELRVRRSGLSGGGLPSYSGYVRLLRWDPVLTPVLLQNMPVIDARVRKLASASVLLEHTHYAGLWFQATSETPGAPKVLAGMPAELVRQRKP